MLRTANAAVRRRGNVIGCLHAISDEDLSDRSLLGQSGRLRDRAARVLRYVRRDPSTRLD
jgi:hypothetical protein